MSALSTSRNTAPVPENGAPAEPLGKLTARVSPSARLRDQRRIGIERVFDVECGAEWPRRDARIGSVLGGIDLDQPELAAGIHETGCDDSTGGVDHPRIGGRG